MLDDKQIDKLLDDIFSAMREDEVCEFIRKGTIRLEEKGYSVKPEEVEPE